MRIGLVGAHRTGKSTLAAKIGESYKLPFIASGVSQIAASMGFDMSKYQPISTRIEFQTAVFDHIKANLEREEAFVTDRTPLDAAAYLMADMQATTGNSVQQEEVLTYVNRAIQLTNRSFDVLILVPPAIPVKETPGKPPVNPAYQEHHHLLCRSLLMDMDADVFWDEIPRDVWDLNERMIFASELIKEAS